MQRASTIFLRIAIIAIGLIVLALCVFMLPWLWGQVEREFPNYSGIVYAVFTAMYIAAIPYFTGLVFAWRLLSLIDKGQAFSVASARMVRAITISAGLISTIYLVSLPFFYLWADKDDAPGLVVVGMVLTGMPFVIFVCAALLGHLVREAVRLKTENELTV